VQNRLENKAFWRVARRRFRSYRRNFSKTTEPPTEQALATYRKGLFSFHLAGRMPAPDDLVARSTSGGPGAADKLGRQSSIPK
jgi:hypothetical protein